MPSPKKSTSPKTTPAKKEPAKKVAVKKPKGAAGGGPVITKQEKEVEMTTFVCSACKLKFMNTGLYFYGVSSTKCMWCKKFPSRNLSK